MLNVYFDVLSLLLLMGFLTWLISVRLHNVAIVDSLWSLMFLSAALLTLSQAPAVTDKNILLLILLGTWSIRLAGFLTLRNFNKPEDRRYAKIRQQNAPGFVWKSLFIVFTLQAVIAWVLYGGLMPGFYTPMQWHWLDIVAITLIITGITFESVADWQLYRFQQSKDAAKAILQTGLWRYSRHPNYFGEFLVWWGFFLMLISQFSVWIILSPLLMTILLLRVSGIRLMEKEINNRRPGYQEYIDRTSAFFPRLPKKASSA